VHTDDARPILVVICDDDPDMLLLMRVSLGIHPRIEVVAEARDGAEALRHVQDSCPDVVVLNVEMPHMGGLEVLPQIKRACPSSEVVLFTGFDRVVVPDIGTAFGIVEKGTSLDRLVGMVMSAAAGKVA
jgi:DNA-binding NarL/FixJ family response regulator